MLRLSERVKYKPILKEMEKRGIGSVLELSRQSGIHNMRLHDLVKMTTPPLNKDFTWKKVATQLADFFKCLPEDLFTKEQQTRVIETNRTNTEVSVAYMNYATIQAWLPEEVFEKQETAKFLRCVVGTLPSREQEIILLRFGLNNGEGKTMEEVGNFLKVSRTRVMQIENRALYKLKRRLSAKALRNF